MGRVKEILLDENYEQLAKELDCKKYSKKRIDNDNLRNKKNR